MEKRPTESVAVPGLPACYRATDRRPWMANSPLRVVVVPVGRSLRAHRWDGRACSAGARSTSAATARPSAAMAHGLLSCAMPRSRADALAGPAYGAISEADF
jgi:hypothetical protein